MKRRNRKFSKTKARRLAEASWTERAREKRLSNLSPDARLESELRQKARDSRGQPLRKGEFVNLCTGEVVTVHVTRGHERTNQFSVNGRDGLDRRGMLYAIGIAIGL